MHTIENERKAIEKMYGKRLTDVSLNIDGLKKQIPFEVYDGYAVCFDHEGHRYDIEFPRMAAIKDSQDFKDAIKDYIGGGLKDEDINALHVLITFAALYVDGVKYDEDKKQTVHK